MDIFLDIATRFLLQPLQRNTKHQNKAFYKPFWITCLTIKLCKGFEKSLGFPLKFWRSECGNISTLWSILIVTANQKCHRGFIYDFHIHCLLLSWGHMVTTSRPHFLNGSVLFQCSHFFKKAQILCDFPVDLNGMRVAAFGARCQRINAGGPALWQSLIHISTLYFKNAVIREKTV